MNVKTTNNLQSSPELSLRLKSKASHNVPLPIKDNEPSCPDLIDLTETPASVPAAACETWTELKPRVVIYYAFSGPFKDGPGSFGRLQDFV